MAVVIGDYWPDGQEKGDNQCFEWDDERIRKECQRGTNRELAAYLRAGYTLKPDMLPVDLVEQLLSGGLTTVVTMKDILSVVAEKHKFTPAQLLGGSKNKDLVAARREAIFLMHTKLGKSLTQIGRFFGRDHSTIHHHFMATKDGTAWRKKNQAKLDRYYEVYRPVAALAESVGEDVGNGG